MLKTAMLVGLVAGLLGGVFHNVVTVPVIEEAIALDEAASADEHVGEPLVSQGAQRVGLLLGTAIFGVIQGAVFVPLQMLAGRVVSTDRQRVAAAIAGGAGFWSISLLPALRYPSNPPGVGEAETLAFRQGFQFLFLLLSAVAVSALLLLVARELRDSVCRAVRDLPGES